MFDLSFRFLYVSPPPPPPPFLILVPSLRLHPSTRRNNQLGEDGAGLLATALRDNKTLHSLDLQFNNVGDHGSTLFATLTQKNKGLRTTGLTVSSKHTLLGGSHSSSTASGPVGGASGLLSLRHQQQRQTIRQTRPVTR